ncbi:MAG: iron-containing alcohol dehydrogenase [Dialister invisus]
MVACYNGDFIIAIGGGSVMDAAKLCSMVKTLLIR